jgi:hypothetical protein
MILSRGRRFIFIHIPKTGGTALALALEDRAKADDILIGDTPKARARKGRLAGVRSAGRLWKHSTIADIAGLATDEEIADFFTLTLVRNPWDRMVSYYHWLRMQGFAHPAVGLAKALSFRAFLAHPQTRIALALWPYGAYMRDALGRERVRAFIRLEHLAEDLPPFEAHLGFALDIARANESQRLRDHRPYYDDDSAALIAELCAEDIARFGYRFDL